jgi:PadR family transcriptional regulator, regulatory protein PadR
MAREIELGDQFAHGYDLVEPLRLLGVHIEEAAPVYKALRHMDQEHLVTTTWKLSSQGPTRREYPLTPEGREQLKHWVALVNQSRDTLQRSLEKYERLNDDGHRNGHDPLSLRAFRNRVVSRLREP